MRAIYLKQFSQPDQIEVSDVPKPEVRSGDVLVRVHAAGVNPSDVKYAGGIVATTPLPRVPGRDFAGIVEEGPETLLRKAVYGSGGDLGITRDGTHAEYVALPVGAVSIKPERLSMVEASAVGVPFIAAFKALVDLALLQRDETVLIVGGSGAVGGAAAQIAKWIGASVIATKLQGEQISSDAASYVDRFVTLPDENLVEVVQDQTKGKGARVVFNVVGGPTFEPGVESLARDGRMVCIAAAGDHRVSFDLMQFYKKQMHWHGLDTLEMSAIDCAAILDQLRPGFESGDFRIQVAREFPLEEARDAYEFVSKGGLGKVVLRMA